MAAPNSRNGDYEQGRTALAFRRSLLGLGWRDFFAADLCKEVWSGLQMTGKAAPRIRLTAEAPRNLWAIDCVAQEMGRDVEREVLMRHVLRRGAARVLRNVTNW